MSKKAIGKETKNIGKIEIKKILDLIPLFTSQLILNVFFIKFPQEQIP
ncbi:hypothetical protein X924_05510 [Petrotoga sp. 9PWA.NaAc.5.4]|nr:hypothetical protein X924_05510 [Petrotoga sp. 9PWA.NaAc.5.4]